MGNGTNVTFTVHAHAKTPANDINNKVNVNCTEDEWNYTNNKANKLLRLFLFHKPVKTVIQ